MENQKRAGNFSEQEVDVLLNLISERKKIIESKQTDAVSVSKKKTCWQELTVEFNSRSGSVHRDEKVLRKKYDNLKKDLKKRNADEKRSLYGTGGGPPISVEKHSSDEMLKSVLHEKQLHGMESIYDCDNLPGGSQQPSNDTFVEYLEVEEANNTTEVVDEIEIIDEAKWDHYDLQKLKKPTHKSLQAGCRYDKRTSWQKLADIKVKWLEENSSIDRKNANEEHEKRMRILDLQEEEAKLRIEEAKKRIRLVDLEIEKIQRAEADRNA